MVESGEVVASYEINIYEVIFKDYNDDILKQEWVEHGKGATPPQDPEREGYKFDGWSVDFYWIEDDLEVIATYILKEYDLPTEISKTTPIKITLAHAMGSANIALMKTYADSFIAKMKAEGYNNITVEIPTGAGNYDTLKNNTINQINNNEMPNLVQGYPDHIAEYLNMNAVLNLNPYINHEKWG